MANKNLSVKHLQRIDTSANWNSQNPILLDGEIGVERDTKMQKVGDGVTTWKNLAYSLGGAHTHTNADLPAYPTTLPANGGNADTLGNLNSSAFATAAQGVKADGAVQKSGGIMSGQLTVSNVFQNGRTFNNVATFFANNTVNEIVIKTKLPYISGNMMPLIHLKGYAYGAQSPIEISVGFYIFDNTLGWCGCTSTCPWDPIIRLSSYMEKGEKYVALSLIKEIYFPRFTVDLTDIWSNTRDYSNGWTVESKPKTDTATIVPQDDITTVPYKPIANDIIGNSSTTTKLLTPRAINGVNFDGTANITVPAVDQTARDSASVAQNAANAKEPAFSKNNAFNKNFGTGVDTVCQGNDDRLSNARHANGGNADTVGGKSASDFLLQSDKINKYCHNFVAADWDSNLMITIPFSIHKINGGIYTYNVEMLVDGKYRGDTLGGMNININYDGNKNFVLTSSRAVNGRVMIIG